MNEGFADIGDGLRRYELWTLLAWRDVQQTNVRSRLGVLWHTIAFFIVAGGIGFLYSDILGQPTELYVPFIGAGLLAWTFINAPLGEGLAVLLRARGMITQIRTPIALYVFHLICKHTYLLGLNLLGYLLVLLAFGLMPRPDPLGFALAVAIYIVAACAATIVLSIASVFQEWVAHLIPSVMRLVFFVTPVLWMPAMLADGSGAHELSLSQGLRSAAVILNPFYHFLEIFRGTLIGTGAPLQCWIVSVALTLILVGTAVWTISRMKNRVLLSL
jgi:ABC-2 type transport system permease protein